MATIHKKVGRGNATNYGVDNQKTFLLEKECLEKLAKNYECSCGLNTFHFPKIVCSYDIPHERGFVLTHCGNDLYYIWKKIYQSGQDRREIPVLEDQVNCIIRSLELNNIKHLDMNKSAQLSGSNLCLNSKGVLSLIDFDIASIGQSYLSKEFAKVAERNWTGYEGFKIKILDICKQIAR